MKPIILCAVAASHNGVHGISQGTVLSLQRGRSPGARSARPQEVREVLILTQAHMLDLGSSGTGKALELRRQATQWSTTLEARQLLLLQSHWCDSEQIIISARIPCHA